MIIQKNSPHERVLVSWPFDGLPPTLAALVGEVQALAQGFDFGCMRPSTLNQNGLDRFILCEDSYLPGEIDSEYLPFLTIKGARHLWLNKLPRRFSFLLGKAREWYPGIGFDVTATSIISHPAMLRISNMFCDG